MCTAIRFRSGSVYFGRTLDLESPYETSIVALPRRFPLPFRHLAALREHYAILGTALVQEGYPLLFDAMNEEGVFMAGLRFEGSCLYRHAVSARENVASFELIAHVLSRCCDVEHARTLLRRTHITDAAFSPSLPPQPLHWLVADAARAIVVEQTAQGLQIYDDPADVLTNAPPFPQQLCRLADVQHLTPNPPQNHLLPDAALPAYSRGLGAMGLPGDSSSVSRFIRAAFLTAHSRAEAYEDAAVAQVFHILQSVAQLRGCVRLADGSYEKTDYSVCYSAREQTYSYTTYENSAITTLSLRDLPPEGERMVALPMEHTPHIRRLSLAP